MKYVRLSLIVLFYFLSYCSMPTKKEVKIDSNFLLKWRRMADRQADRCCKDSTNSKDIKQKVGIINIYRKSMFSYIKSDSCPIKSLDNLEILEHLGDNNNRYDCFLKSEDIPENVISIYISHIPDTMIINNKKLDMIHLFKNYSKEKVKCCNGIKSGNKVLSIYSKFELSKSDSLIVKECTINLD